MVIFQKILTYKNSLKVYEKKTVTNVLGNNEGIESFTVEVRSLPTNMSMVDLKAKLWYHFSSVKLPFVVFFIFFSSWF